MDISSLLRKKSVEKIQADAAAGYSDGEPLIDSGLRKTLGVVDLTAFGIAAIIGAGIFSTIGNASYDGGPAVIFLFIFTAIACAFSAFCYAEFAAMIPVAGSAYTYAYASFGELVAWIIGWDLLMEYSIGNIAVAISWSDYFTGLLDGYGLHIPEYFTMDFLTASRGFDKVTELLASGKTLADIKAMPDIASAIEAYTAWTTSPVFAGLHVVCDLPALAITVIITTLVFVGIRESKTASNVMVALKLAVIFLVIVLGSFYVNPTNWSPFAPNGAAGVLKGVSAVFFAYIGFDAISTTAEECKNPQRDLPLGMMYSLIICTVLYVLVSLILTGMVSYKSLQVGDPLAFVFGPNGANVSWISGIIGISAVIAMSTVLLVFQMGQPRIWMSMSRDGLLPPIFSAIHPKFKTPWFSTLVAGFVVAIPSLFLNLTEVTDLTSIGTLFAFVLVCGGVLLLHHSPQKIERRFKTPYINSKYIAPAVLVAVWIGLYIFNHDGMASFFSLHDAANPDAGVWDVAKHKIPLFVYMLSSFVMTWACFKNNLSLIPVCGLMSCGYLMTELGIINWTRFLLWLIFGLMLYFFYSRTHSKLNSDKS
jgi:APA family basic amino acid/polyamine antiporter